MNPSTPANPGLPRRLLLSATAAMAAAPGRGSAQAAGPAGPVTDILFNQPQPAHPLMGEHATLGHVTPVGGIGPYAWSLVSMLDARYNVDAVSGRVTATGASWGRAPT